MNFEQYRGKKVMIRSIEIAGVIEDVKVRRGINGISARFIVMGDDEKYHELMPHEVKIVEDDAPMMGMSY